MLPGSRIKWTTGVFTRDGSFAFMKTRLFVASWSYNKNKKVKTYACWHRHVSMVALGRDIMINNANKVRTILLDTWSKIQAYFLYPACSWHAPSELVAMLDIDVKKCGLCKSMNLHVWLSDKVLVVPLAAAVWVHAVAPVATVQHSAASVPVYEPGLLPVVTVFVWKRMQRMHLKSLKPTPA